MWKDCCKDLIRSFLSLSYFYVDTIQYDFIFELAICLILSLLGSLLNMLTVKRNSCHVSVSIIVVVVVCVY